MAHKYNALYEKGNEINGYKLLDKDNTHENNTHVYWRCKCTACGQSYIIRSSRIKTQLCPCRKNKLEIFNKIKKSEKNSIFRGVQNRGEEYEVNITYNRKYYYMI